MKKQYFLAANGYLGFRSYFETEFNSKNYTQIYVLKGGPGTGKSSLMRKISSKFDSLADMTEEILCSSDPKSLDGVILSKKGKKVAILDGTNPHERDAVIPGAVDEIVDLGKGWDKRFLQAQRENILDLNKQKKFAYKTAYSYLAISGAINNEIAKIANQLYASKNAELNINSQAEKNRKEHTRLISAFCKHNLYTLDSLENTPLKKIFIKGEKEICYLFLNDILSKSRLFANEITRFPSPLDNSKTEAILIHDSDTVYLIGDGENSIDITENVGNDKVVLENFSRLKILENETLSEAARWFNIASEFHFRLEEIYSSAMNFSVIDEISESILDEIGDILLK